MALIQTYMSAVEVAEEPTGHGEDEALPMQDPQTDSMPNVQDLFEEPADELVQQAMQGPHFPAPWRDLMTESMPGPEAAASDAVEAIPEEEPEANQEGLTATRPVAYPETFTGFVQLLHVEVHTCKQLSDGAAISLTIPANQCTFDRAPMQEHFFNEYIEIILYISL